MGRNRFTANEVDRLPLSDGDWVEVKRDLNNGDQKKLENAGIDPPVKLADGTITHPINWERHEIERAAIFLLDWSLRDANDKPRLLKKKDGSISLDALRALNPEDFDEISDAITAHRISRAAAKKAEREARQKLSEETPPSSATDAQASDLTSGS